MTKSNTPEGHCKKYSCPTYTLGGLDKIRANQQRQDVSVPVAEGKAEEKVHDGSTKTEWCY